MPGRCRAARRASASCRRSPGRWSACRTAVKVASAAAGRSSSTARRSTRACSSCSPCATASATRRRTTLPVDAGRALHRREAAIARGRDRARGARPRPPGAGAAGPVRARHYAPDEPGGPHPLLVFFHGGGFVVGDLDTHDAPCRVLCRHGGVHVLSVDYRLAPEHPFPAGVDDVPRGLALGGRARGRARRRPGAGGGRRRQRGRQPRGGRQPGRPPRRGTGAGAAAADLPGHGRVAHPAVARAVRRRLLPDQRADRLVRRPLRARRARTRRTRAARRCWRRTCPGSRPRSSSPPASTRCATRARPTPRRCGRPACPSSCAASRRCSTASSTRAGSTPPRAPPCWRRPGMLRALPTRPGPRTPQAAANTPALSRTSGQGIETPRRAPAPRRPSSRQPRSSTPSKRAAGEVGAREVAVLEHDLLQPGALEVGLREQAAGEGDALEPRRGSAARSARQSANVEVGALALRPVEPGQAPADHAACGAGPRPRTSALARSQAPELGVTDVEAGQPGAGQVDALEARGVEAQAGQPRAGGVHAGQQGAGQPLGIERLGGLEVSREVGRFDAHAGRISHGASGHDGAQAPWAGSADTAGGEPSVTWLAHTRAQSEDAPPFRSRS